MSDVKPRYRYTKLKANEVSLVDAGANGRAFAVTKQRGTTTMADQKPVTVRKDNDKDLNGWSDLSLNVYFSPEEAIQILTAVMGGKVFDVAKGLTERAQGRVAVVKSAAGTGPAAVDVVDLLKSLQEVQKNVTALQTKYPNLKLPDPPPAGSTLLPGVSDGGGTGNKDPEPPPADGGAPLQAAPVTTLGMDENSITVIKNIFTAALAPFQAVVEKGMSELRIEVEKAKKKADDAATDAATAKDDAGKAKKDAEVAVTKAAEIRPPPASAGELTPAPVPVNKAAAVSFKGVL